MMLRVDRRHRKWLILLGLVDAFVVGVAAGIFYARPRLCFDVSCNYFNTRLWVIETTIQQVDKSPRYLAIGDSIMEAATLPDICGRRPINAGIVGATVETFGNLGRRLADLAQPDFVIVALGTNDALNHRKEGFQDRLSALISSLKLWPVIVVPLPPGYRVKDITEFNAAIEGLHATKVRALERVDTTDGVHLTAASYVIWKNSIMSAASKVICPG